MKTRLALALTFAAAQAQAAPPAATTAGQTQARDPAYATKLPAAEKWALLHQHIRYVFVLFQENRSFDHYFGTYPGANGLFATYSGASAQDPTQQSARDGASFHQALWRRDGTIGAITPFLIPRTLTNADGKTVQLYPEDIQSVAHSRASMASDMHFDRATRTTAKNDAYAITNEGLSYSDDQSSPASLVTKAGAPITTKPTLATVQAGELVMAHVDCDTIPFLWRLADRFTLFDNFHQTTIGSLHPQRNRHDRRPDRRDRVGASPRHHRPSPRRRHRHPQPRRYRALRRQHRRHHTRPQTPARPGQAGVRPTQHRARPARPHRRRPPDARAAERHPRPLQCVAKRTRRSRRSPSPRSRSRSWATPSPTPSTHDENPATDLADITADIAAIGAGQAPTAWGWYQQGYAREPFDGAATIFLEPATTAHPSYIVHHNGPQYFGYLGDNPAELAHLHGLQDFYTDIAAHKLPPAGGVFYVRGGYYNNANPANA